MATWIMGLVAAAVLALPVVLALAFHGRDRADSRGRRLHRDWRASLPSR